MNNNNTKEKHEEKINKLDFIKIKKFNSSKDSITAMKRNSICLILQMSITQKR